jgi:hypothetical protein
MKVDLGLITARRVLKGRPALRCNSGFIDRLATEIAPELASRRSSGEQTFHVVTSERVDTQDAAADLVGRRHAAEELEEPLRLS